jgi:hypothetical protein
MQADPYGAGWPGAAAPTGSSDWSGAAQSHPADPPWPEPAHPRTTTPGDPYGLPATVTTAPRIEPSPQPPTPTRLFTGLLIGLLTGLLLFGTAGWLTGRATAPKATTTSQPAAPGAAKLGIFEQSQAALNKKDFQSTPLLKLAQGWLPYLSSCARSAARQGDGEKARIRCSVDGMSAFFVAYGSTAERDKARNQLRKQTQDARALTPGVAPSGNRVTPSGRTSGDYVEYAYKLTEGGVTRTVAGIWWDDAQTPIAAYLLAYWKDGIGERWEPMRDLWSRYA